MSIKKLVIPVAGLGTRFLPATKAQPKEMLPLVDKPIIQYIVESAVKAGIEDIILITGPGKRALEDHFSPNYELQNWLKKQGKEKIREEVKKISDLANFIFVRQKGPYGNGTPVLCAKSIIGDNPFAVVWGDDIWHCRKKPQVKQLIEVYEKYGDPVLTAKEITKEQTTKYAVIDGVEVEDSILQVKNVIEKPGPEKAPSLIGSFGGFVLTPDIFKALEETKLGKDNELWLVDALFKVLQKRPIYAKMIEGDYYDTGSKIGYLKASVTMALEREELQDEFLSFLKETVK